MFFKPIVCPITIACVIIVFPALTVATAQQDSAGDSWRRRENQSRAQQQRSNAALKKMSKKNKHHYPPQSSTPTAKVSKMSKKNGKMSKKNGTPLLTPPLLDGPEAQRGIATFYDGTVDGGACGYATLPTASFPFGFQVQTGGSAFNDGYGCGACYEITCDGSNEAPGSPCSCDSKKKVVVQATDFCPGCESNHINMNSASFNTITSTEICGLIKTTYRRVDCDFQGGIIIRSKQGTSGYWYGLHVDGVAGYGTLNNVKLRQASSRESGQLDFHINCDKSGGASYWWCDLEGLKPIQAPLDVLFTDSAQRTLELNNVITDLGGNLIFNLGENFPPAQSTFTCHPDNNKDIYVAGENRIITSTGGEILSCGLNQVCVQKEGIVYYRAEDLCQHAWTCSYLNCFGNINEQRCCKIGWKCNSNISPLDFNYPGFCFE